MRNNRQKVEVGTMDLSGGLVSMLRPHQLEEGQASYIRNLTPFEEYGAMKTRLGSAFYVTTDLTDSTVVSSGLYQYVKASGTSYFYLAHGKSIYEMAAPTTRTARYTDADDLGDVNFVTFADTCIAVGPTMPTEESTGGAFSPLAGSPPANGKYIEVHKERIWITNTTNPSRVSYCVQGDKDDWTTIVGDDTDAGFIDVGGDDGDIITGLASIGNVMIVFKKNSTWMITGAHANDFAVRPLSKLIGCIAPKSIVKCDQFALFLSDMGVYSVTSNGNGVIRMSDNIQPDIDAYSRSRREAAVAGRYKTQYWLTLTTSTTDSTVGLTNIVDLTYVLDWILGSWTTYSYIRPTRYLTAIDGTMYMQSRMAAENHDIIQLNTGLFDEDWTTGSLVQTYVPWFWHSKDYDGGSFTRTKVINDLIVAGGALSGTYITYSLKLDSTDHGTAYVASMTPTVSEAMVIAKGGVHLVDTTFRHFVRIMFSGVSTAGGRQTLYGYSMLMDVFERENG